jgi:hypothetical protein
MTDQSQPIVISQPNWFAKKSTEVSDSNLDYSIFSGKNGIIIILAILVILSLIGVNLLYMFGNIIDWFTDTFGPIIKNVLAMMGFSTGVLINNTADVAADAANLGVDIAKGTTQSIGDLLINSSQGGVSDEEKKRLEQALTSPKCATNKTSEPAPVQSSEPTVTNIASQKPKAGWCYVGDYIGSRGCVSMAEHNKCMSGQVFPSQSACLNPDAQK